MIYALSVPKTFRQSLMIVIAFAAPRLVMAALFARRFTLLGHSFRGVAPTRYIPG